MRVDAVLLPPAVHRLAFTSDPQWLPAAANNLWDIDSITRLMRGHGVQVVSATGAGGKTTAAAALQLPDYFLRAWPIQKLDADIRRVVRREWGKVAGRVPGWASPSAITLCLPELMDSLQTWDLPLYAHMARHVALAPPLVAAAAAITSFLRLRASSRSPQPALRVASAAADESGGVALPTAAPARSGGIADTATATASAAAGQQRRRQAAMNVVGEGVRSGNLGTHEARRQVQAHGGSSRSHMRSPQASSGGTPGGAIGEIGGGKPFNGLHLRVEGDLNLRQSLEAYLGACERAMVCLDFGPQTLYVATALDVVPLETGTSGSADSGSSSGDGGSSGCSSGDGVGSNSNSVGALEQRMRRRSLFDVMNVAASVVTEESVRRWLAGRVTAGGRLAGRVYSRETVWQVLHRRGRHRYSHRSFMDGLNWEQKAAIDFLVLRSAAKVVGTWQSSFSVSLREARALDNRTRDTMTLLQREHKGHHECCLTLAYGPDAVTQAAQPCDVERPGQGMLARLVEILG